MQRMDSVTVSKWASTSEILSLKKYSNSSDRKYSNSSDRETTNLKMLVAQFYMCINSES